MVDVLQQFSTTSLTSVLVTMIGFWLVWPVLCGVLGASRGQGLAGVMHGFLWGPLGLLFVLLSKKKYICPTCGQKTLHQPLDHEERSALWDIPTVARPVPPVIRDASPPPISDAPEPACEPVGAYTVVNDDPEITKLREWVSGESD